MCLDTSLAVGLTQQLMQQQCMPRALCKRADCVITSHVACSKHFARHGCAKIRLLSCFSMSYVCGAGDAGLEASHWDALLNTAWCPVLTVCPEEGKQALVCTTALC